MQHRGEHYQLYCWFSCMWVARVMQAIPSNCRFLIPFMYPCDKKRSISPIPMNMVTGSNFMRCECCHCKEKNHSLQVNFNFGTTEMKEHKMLMSSFRVVTQQQSATKTFVMLNFKKPLDGKWSWQCFQEFSESQTKYQVHQKSSNLQGCICNKGYIQSYRQTIALESEGSGIIIATICSNPPKKM